MLEPTYLLTIRVCISFGVVRETFAFRMCHLMCQFVLISGVDSLYEVFPGPWHNMLSFSLNAEQWGLNKCGPARLPKSFRRSARSLLQSAVGAPFFPGWADHGRFSERLSFVQKEHVTILPRTWTLLFVFPFCFSYNNSGFSLRISKFHHGDSSTHS